MDDSHFNSVIKFVGEKKNNGAKGGGGGKFRNLKHFVGSRKEVGSS